MQYELTQAQKNARDAIVRGDSATAYSLMGYAGTGKTVTASETIRGLNQDNDSGAVVVLAPTAAALAVIENKLEGMSHDLFFRTVASVVQTPVDVLKTPDGMPDFDLTPEGLESLGALLKRLKINSAGLVKAVDRRSFASFNVNIDDAVSELRNSNTYINVDTDALGQRVFERLKNKKLSQFSVMKDTRYVEPSEASARLFGRLKGTKFDSITAVVVDEYSMVNEEVSVLLKTAVTEYLGAKFVVVGDPGQLEPVEGEVNSLITGQDTSAQSFELTEILRSNDSVAELASMVRKGVSMNNLSALNLVTRADGLSIEDAIRDNYDTFLNAGTVVTFKNKNVNKFNEILRDMHGIHGNLSVGDRLVCTQNVYGAGDKNGSFRNGELLEVTAVGDGCSAIASDIKKLEAKAQSAPATSEIHTILGHVYAGHLIGAQVTNKMGDVKTLFTWSHTATVSRNKRELHEKILNEGDDVASPAVPTSFAYALTVHKAQGSEWENVVYYATKRDLAIQKTTNAPYTAVTRAKSKIDIIYDSRN